MSCERRLIPDRPPFRYRKGFERAGAAVAVPRVFTTSAIGWGRSAPSSRGRRTVLLARLRGAADQLNGSSDEGGVAGGNTAVGKREDVFQADAHVVSGGGAA